MNVRTLRGGTGINVSTNASNEAVISTICDPCSGTFRNQMRDMMDSIYYANLKNSLEGTEFAAKGFSAVLPSSPPVDLLLSVEAINKAVNLNDSAYVEVQQVSLLIDSSSIEDYQLILPLPTPANHLKIISATVWDESPSNVIKVKGSLYGTLQDESPLYNGTYWFQCVKHPRDGFVWTVVN